MTMAKAAARQTPALPRATRNVVPGQVVVKLTMAARGEPGRLQEILDRIAPGARVKSTVDRFGMALVEAAESDGDRLLESLRESDAVEFAEPSLFESGS
jgi:hypothetical protein